MQFVQLSSICVPSAFPSLFALNPRFHVQVTHFQLILKRRRKFHANIAPKFLFVKHTYFLAIITSTGCHHAHPCVFLVSDTSWWSYVSASTDVVGGEVVLASMPRGRRGGKSIIFPFPFIAFLYSAAIGELCSSSSCLTLLNHVLIPCFDTMYILVWLNQVMVIYSFSSHNHRKWDQTVCSKAQWGHGDQYHTKILAKWSFVPHKQLSNIQSKTSISL